MAEPSRLMGQSISNNDVEDSDIDAEGEEDDTGFGQTTRETSQAGITTDAEGSGADAEGEEVDDEDDEDASEPVGAVKVKAKPVVRAASTSDEEEADDDAIAVLETSSEAFAKSSGSEESSSDTSEESEAEVPWEGESDAGEEAEAEIADPNHCIYCGGDEDNDPGEEFEEYLACAVCGDNAHRQCARDAKTLRADDDAQQWRCSNCVDNGLEADEQQSSEALTRRRLSSVPKLARDLLPSHRGADPGGHSIFKDLILPDEPLDGSRSLRKRKASHEEEHPPTRQIRKKRRSSETSKSEVEVASLPASSPRAVRIAVSDAIETDDARASASEGDASKARISRPRRQRPQRRDKRPLVWIEESVGLSLIVAFHLNNERMQKILFTKPKKKQPPPPVRDRSRKTQQVRPESPEISHYPAIQTHYAAPFYSFADKDVDETKNKPYGGILSEVDADTSKTYPTAVDRKRFEEARLKAEEDWKVKQAALYGSQESTRAPHKQSGPPSKIKCINFGGWEIDTWHAAPYPEEYSKNKVLYICEFCLKYMNSDYVAWRHKLKCPAKHPPGDEIYRDGRFSFFEVDGRKNPVYCQNLCLLAKLFLGSKTLYYDVEPFLFYVMTENDNLGCHFVGYFSKEKRPSSLNNVSCILVLPIHQRKGYGQFLIEFSYLLTRVEKKTGSPEKPLSDMGLVSYRTYWRLVMCQELVDQRAPISIAAISERTGMTADDIVSALEGLRALIRDPVTKKYALRLDLNYYKQYIEKCDARNHPKINPDALVWTPYVMGRISQYEDGPAIHTVQPREELNEEDQPAPEEGVQMAARAAKQNGDGDDPSSTVTKNGSADDGEVETPRLLKELSYSAMSPRPSTPTASGTFSRAAPQTPDIYIPPIRYEIFPPIPGITAGPPKRRAGRPFGSRRRTSTPQRNRNLSHSLTIATAPLSKTIQLSPSKNGNGKASPLSNGALTPSGSITVRRTRSKLGEMVNGVGLGEEEEDEDGGEVKAVNGNRSHSSSGSPKARGRGKGEGKAFDADAEEEYEPEEEEEEDIDAEGEDEDTVDVVMADA